MQESSESNSVIVILKVVGYFLQNPMLSATRGSFVLFEAPHFLPSLIILIVFAKPLFVFMTSWGLGFIPSGIFQNVIAVVKAFFAFARTVYRAFNKTLKKVERT